MHNNENITNIFSSKALVLQFLENRINESKIKKPFVFTVSEWDNLW
jgi:hypothetical protein